MASFPERRDGDVDAVIDALDVAEAHWRRGDLSESVRWIRRAADAAFDANDDARGVELSKAAAELSSTPRTAKPPPPPPPRVAPPSPPPPPVFSQAPPPPSPPPATPPPVTTAVRPAAPAEPVSISIPPPPSVPTTRPPAPRASAPMPTALKPSTAPRSAAGTRRPSGANARRNTRPPKFEPARRHETPPPPPDSDRPSSTEPLPLIRTRNPSQRPPPMAPPEEYGEGDSTAVMSMTSLRPPMTVSTVRPERAAEEITQTSVLPAARHPVSPAVRVAISRSDAGLSVRVLDGGGLRPGESEAWVLATDPDTDLWALLR